MCICNICHTQTTQVKYLILSDCCTPPFSSFEERHFCNICTDIVHLKLESTHRVQTSSANTVCYPKVRYPSKTFINIHLQVSQFVFNAKNALSVYDGKVEKIDPVSRSVPKSN